MLWYECWQKVNILTEPRWPLQPRGTQWFLRIGLFVVRAISLGPCRRPIEYLTSSHPCGRLSKIPNSQIHKVKKWKILSNFRRKNFFVISHERKNRFFVVIWPKKTLRHIKYWPKIDLFFPKNQNFAPKHKILKNPMGKFCRFHYCDFLKVPYFCRINSGQILLQYIMTLLLCPKDRVLLTLLVYF